MSFKSLKSACTVTRHIGSAAFAAAICVASAPSSSQAETPDYFVEWVQPSSPNLYVDTGVRGKVGVKAELQYIHVQNGNYPVMLGSWGGEQQAFQPRHAVGRAGTLGIW